MWQNFFTNETFPGGQVVTVTTTDLSQFPLFQRQAPQFLQFTTSATTAAPMMVLVEPFGDHSLRVRAQPDDGTGADMASPTVQVSHCLLLLPEQFINLPFCKIITPVSCSQSFFKKIKN